MEQEIQNEVAKRAIDHHLRSIQRISAGSDSYSQLEDLYAREDAVTAIKGEFIISNEETA